MLAKNAKSGSIATTMATRTARPTTLSHMTDRTASAVPVCPATATTLTISPPTVVGRIWENSMLRPRASANFAPMAGTPLSISIIACQRKTKRVNCTAASTAASASSVKLARASRATTPTQSTLRKTSHAAPAVMPTRATVARQRPVFNDYSSVTAASSAARTRSC